MSIAIRKRAGVLAIAAAVAAVALGFTVYAASSTGDPAEQQCDDGRGQCPKQACNSACWADGTHHNNGTKVRNTIIAPPECPPGGGCVTEACN